MSIVFFDPLPRPYNVMKPLQSITVPHEIVNDEFVTIVKCYFKNADKIKEGDTLIAIETSKMVQDLYATVDGYIYYLCHEEDEVPIGKAILEIYDQPLVKRSTFIQETVEKKVSSLGNGDVVFSQSALRLMEELKMSKDLFKGKDFVGTEEVKSVQRQIGQGQPAGQQTDIEFQKISLFKKREIEYLTDVQSSNLNNTVSIFIDITPGLNELRRASKFFKNSLLPIVISKLPSLLKEYPEFNAFYKDGTIGFYRKIAIGFAVNLGEGLRVLKLPSSNDKSISEIEIFIFDMIKQYVAKKLTPKDMEGVTFTITDLSNEGIHFFIPLIPKGQSAILGVCAIDEKLQRSIVSFSFDHRVTDGKKAGEFLRKLKKALETT